jgi:hypothetical protein
MKKSKIAVTHKGVTVYISVLQTSKRGQPYTEFVISDYTSGERQRHVRAAEGAARIKAREMCEALAGGRGDVLEWDESQRRDIHQALKLIENTDTGIDRAAFIFSEAAKLVGVDEILTACQQWKNNRPDKPITPKPVKETVTLFNEAQKTKVSERRQRTVKSYLKAYTDSFGTRNLHEITTGDIEAWLEEKTWGNKTRNEVVGAIGLLYTFAQTAKRDWVPVDYNPVAKVKRERLEAGNIEIFEPWEARQMLTRIETDYADLIPFLVLWCFSGCRKEEIARVSWQQVQAAIKTGKLEVRSGETKNGPSRVMPLLPNAKAWLQWWLAKYGEKASGVVLPARWNTMTALDDMGKLLSRNCGLVWKDNGWRHSYVSYRCLILDSTVTVANESGNSPAKIERHYRNKAVTMETAKEWFAIMPPKDAENVVLMEVAA